MSVTVSDDRETIDFDTVWRWLSGTYWGGGVTRDGVEHAARHSSLVVGAYFEGEQVGYLRVVSDRFSFAYVCDVFVSERHRRRGVATAMIRFCLAHPGHQGLRRWLLVTRDAQRVYQASGFAALTNPENWMVLSPAPAVPADDVR